MLAGLGARDASDQRRQVDAGLAKLVRPRVRRPGGLQGIRRRAAASEDRSLGDRRAKSRLGRPRRAGPGREPDRGAAALEVVDEEDVALRALHEAVTVRARGRTLVELEPDVGIRRRGVQRGTHPGEIEVGVVVRRGRSPEVDPGEVVLVVDASAVRSRALVGRLDAAGEHRVTTRDCVGQADELEGPTAAGRRLIRRRAVPGHRREAVPVGAAGLVDEQVAVGVLEAGLVGDRVGGAAAGRGHDGGRRGRGRAEGGEERGVVGGEGVLSGERGGARNRGRVLVGTRKQMGGAHGVACSGGVTYPVVRRQGARSRHDCEQQSDADSDQNGRRDTSSAPTRRSAEVPPCAHLSRRSSPVRCGWTTQLAQPPILHLES